MTTPPADPVQEAERHSELLRKQARALEAYVVHNGSLHDDDCPADDTCGCSLKWINDGVNAAIRSLHSNAFFDSLVRSQQEENERLKRCTRWTADRHGPCGLCELCRKSSVADDYAAGWKVQAEEIATLQAENARLADEWARRYDTPPWRSLESMYREAYPGRDVVHVDVLRWADTFIAARRGERRESISQAADGFSDSLSIAMKRAEKAEAQLREARAQALEAVRRKLQIEADAAEAVRLAKTLNGNYNSIAQWESAARTMAKAVRIVDAELVRARAASERKEGAS